MKKSCLIFFSLFSCFLSFASCETDDDDQYVEVINCPSDYSDSSYVYNDDDSLASLPIPQWALGDSLHIKSVEFYMGHGGVNVSMQGGDTYNGFFFQFQDKNANVFIYDLERKELIQSVPLPQDSRYHCNNASFSRVFYEEGDEYPLLYVGNGNSSSFNQVIVYRISRTNDLFYFEKVQEFVLPQATPDNYLYATDAIIDNYGKYMYVASKGITNAIKVARICKYKLPDPHFSQKFELSEKCIVDSFSMPHLDHRQGGTIVGNKLYFVAGVPHWGTTPELVVIDLEKRKSLQRIDLRKFGYNIEPEDIFLYKNTFFIASNKRGIHKVVFDNMEDQSND